jgi:hypothetical protein
LISHPSSPYWAAAPPAISSPTDSTEGVSAIPVNSLPIRSRSSAALLCRRTQHPSPNPVRSCFSPPQVSRLSHDDGVCEGVDVSERRRTGQRDVFWNLRFTRCNGSGVTVFLSSLPLHRPHLPLSSARSACRGFFLLAGVHRVLHFLLRQLSALPHLSPITIRAPTARCNGQETWPLPREAPLDNTRRVRSGMLRLLPRFADERAVHVRFGSHCDPSQRSSVPCVCTHRRREGASHLLRLQGSKLREAALR